MKSTGKPMPWFRLYAEAVDDEKLRLLAFEDRWHFVALLCCKGQGILPEDGEKVTDLVRRKVAVKLGLDVRAFEEAVRRLAEVGLVDQDSLQPIAWTKRQARSDADPTAADRKRRQRSREAAEANSLQGTSPDDDPSTGHDSVTRDASVTQSVTSQVRHGNVTPLEVEEEGYIDSVPPSGVTGGEPPADPAVMTKEQLWAASKSMLAAAAMPAKQCGAFVGALVSRYGEDVAKEALRAALLARPADPASYLTAACQHAAGKRRPVAVGRQQALESNNQAVAARLAAGG
jgi:hypothetical protein